MDLNAISVFASVVQAGSFTQAARSLQMPKSTVSHKVAELEKHLGVTLLKRTTRKLHLTEAGQDYFDTCAKLLGELRQADARVSESREDRKPRGLLRITAPVEMGSGMLDELFGRFLKAYPEVELELLLTDRYVDLIAENVDLAIRAGDLADSGLIARKLGTASFQLFASPAYLRKHGAPSRPQDLEQHACLRFTVVSDSNFWELRSREKYARIPVKGPISANNLLALRELSVGGLGIVLVPQYLCLEDVRKGRLVPVLPAWATDEAPVHAVYAAAKFVPPKVSAFVEHLSRSLKERF